MKYLRWSTGQNVSVSQFGPENCEMFTFFNPNLFYWPAGGSRDCLQRASQNKNMADIPSFSVENALFQDSLSIKKNFDDSSSEKYTLKFHNICSLLVYDLWFVCYYDESFTSRYKIVTVSRFLPVGVG